MVVIGITNAVAQIQAGKVRGLAVLSSCARAVASRRADGKGGRDRELRGDLAGTACSRPRGPRAIFINRLNAEWVKIAADPDTKEKMQNRRFRDGCRHPRTVLRVHQAGYRPLEQGRQGGEPEC